MTSGRFAKFDQKDLNDIAAKGILEKIKVVRQKLKYEQTSRRLLWELIQNAKDNASLCKFNNTENVIVKITLKPSELIFSHTNGYFTNDNIRALIRRSSSEDKEIESNPEAVRTKTTGRFGTGFMTTHLLSELVTVTGLFNLDDDFKYFELLLDRTGRTKVEIIDSINNSFNQVEQFLDMPTKVCDKNEFNTKFIYNLDNEGIKVAKQAIAEVVKTLGYVLINIPSIEEIIIEEEGEISKYKISKQNYSSLNNGIIYYYNLIKNEKIIESYIEFIKNKVAIIIPFSINYNNYYIKKLEENIPRLFLDFPLVGSEILNLPFIINSHYFEPIETRDGVSLTYSNDADTNNNKDLLVKAKNLYLELIIFICNKQNYHDLYNLARIKAINRIDWVSKDWFDKEITLPIQNKLIVTPIVETINKGRFPIEGDNATVDFLRHKNEKKLKDFYNLCKDVDYYILPIYEHVKIWNEIIWTDKYNVKLDNLCEFIEQKQLLLNLIEYFDNNIDKTIDWLNNFYEFLEQNKDINPKAVYLNQKGVLCELKDLYYDDNIDEKIKDIAEDFGISIRSYLLDKRINVIKEKFDILKLAQSIEIQVKKIWKSDERIKYKKPMMELFYWLRNNDEKAKEIFNAIYDQQFLLIDDQQLFEKVGKAEILDEYLDVEGMSFEIFKEKLKKPKIEPKKDEEQLKDEAFSKQFDNIEPELIQKIDNENLKYFTEGETKTFNEKLIEIINSLDSIWKGYIYHFTHVENAAKIINNHKFLSRSKADFINSAGSGYINNTQDSIKDFVRFYLRPLTPTQYYNEGLGKKTKLGDLPQCPVPVFFKFNMKEVLSKNKDRCFISNGNLRHYPNINFGNDYEFLKKVNFRHLYSNFGSCELSDFLNASQQEFIIEDEFEFNEIEDFEIICNSEADRETLINLVNDDLELMDKIKIDRSYFYNYNQFVKVKKEWQSLIISFNANFDKELVEIEMATEKNNTILKSCNSLIIETKNSEIIYNIYYISPDNQKWLIYTNGNKDN